MVIDETFVWVHFPKAAGDATLGLFRRFPKVIVHADDATSTAKHTRFAGVEDQLHEKLLVMNIRPLPAWILSFAHHLAKRTGRDMAPETIKELVSTLSPDGKLKAFCDDGRFEIDCWLRTEHLADDFLDLISTVTEVSPRARRKVERAGRVNERRYDRNVDAWFTPEDVQRLYEENPLWASIERTADTALA
jgi:hypothetical protein